MLAALLTALFITLFGGASYGKHPDLPVTDVQKKVEQVISPKERREQVLAHLKAIEKEMKEYNKDLGKTVSAVSKHAKDRQVTRGYLEAVIDSLAASRQAALRRIVDERFRMKDLMSRAEWEKIFDVRDG